MNFYVEVDKNGNLIKAQKESFDNSELVKVPEKYAEYFIEYLTDFMYFPGQPISAAFPKNSLILDNKIYAEKLADLDDNDEDTATELKKLSSSMAFLIKQVSDLENENKALSDRIEALEKPATNTKGDAN